MGQLTSLSVSAWLLMQKRFKYRFPINEDSPFFLITQSNEGQSQGIVEKVHTAQWIYPGQNKVKKICHGIQLSVLRPSTIKEKIYGKQDWVNKTNVNTKTILLPL